MAIDAVLVIDDRVVCRLTRSDNLGTARFRGDAA